jgi:hypothetical protein
MTAYFYCPCKETINFSKGDVLMGIQDMDTERSDYYANYDQSEQYQIDQALFEEWRRRVYEYDEKLGVHFDQSYQDQANAAAARLNVLQEIKNAQAKKAYEQAQVEMQTADLNFSLADAKPMLGSVDAVAGRIPQVGLGSENFQTWVGDDKTPIILNANLVKENGQLLAVVPDFEIRRAMFPWEKFKDIASLAPQKSPLDDVIEAFKFDRLGGSDGMHPVKQNTSVADNSKDLNRMLQSDEPFVAGMAESMLEENKVASHVLTIPLEGKNDQVKETKKDPGTAIQKAINITASFEGRGYVNVAGNFDGQYLSVGMIQWNIGQGTLQPLLKEFVKNYPDKAREIFGSEYQSFLNALYGTKDDIKSWGLSINNGENLLPEWEERFITLCKTKEFQEIQNQYMQDYISDALRMADIFSLKTEKGLALMFDIAVQNGGITPEEIGQDNMELIRKLAGNEQEIMRIIAEWVVRASNPMYQDDVRARKFAIINGTGKVHGRQYNLSEDFGITDSFFK